MSWHGRTARRKARRRAAFRAWWLAAMNATRPYQDDAA